MNIQELLSLTNSICSTEAEPEALLEMITDYSEAFSIWFSANQETTLKNPDESEAALLIQLSEKHEAVLVRSEELKKFTKHEMGELKKRGAGIMAYTNESSPSRISFTRPKKG